MTDRSTDRSDASGPPTPEGRGAEPVPALPDFTAGARDAGRGGPGGPAGRDDTGGHDDPGARSDAGRGPLLALLLGGGALLVAVVAVVALALSPTVFRSAEDAPDDEGGTASATEEPERERRSEYVPTQEQSDEGEGESESVLAEQPSVDCTVLENVVESEQVEGAVRGGGLEFPQPEGWEVGSDWSGADAYLSDQSFAHQAVESGWFAVSGVGAVEFPQEEGGYPGAEEAARAIFQCALTRDSAEELYDDPAEMRDHRDEAFTVDGHPAWIVSADVQISDLALLHTTDAWRLVVIVVDTPEGPAAFDGGAALGHEQQVADLDAMLEGLRLP